MCQEVSIIKCPDLAGRRHEFVPPKEGVVHYEEFRAFFDMMSTKNYKFLLFFDMMITNS